MRNIYKNEKGEKLFRKSFCAYLDILGFSEKIQKNDIPYFENYLTVLDTELKHIEDYHDLSGNENFKSFELKIFTDNFVFGHPWFDEFGESELGTIFDVLAHIQFNFAISNIFIRGAITMSDLYMDENIVLGPAIIDAYKLESEKAIYPRVILSDNIIEVVKKHISYYAVSSSSPQSREYLIDIDGYYFINYLFTIVEYNSLDEENIDEENIRKLITKHKEIVISNIAMHKDNFKLYDKFAWVARYHNYFCNNFLNEFENIDLKSIKIDEGLITKSISKLI